MGIENDTHCYFMVALYPIIYFPTFGIFCRATATTAEAAKPATAETTICTGVVQTPSTPSVPTPNHERIAPQIGTKISR